MANTSVQQRQQRRSLGQRIAYALSGAAFAGLIAGAAQAAPERAASLIMDYSSGATLYSQNADEPRHPASLT